MGVLQERITSTKTGSITSVQAVYVPADDLTDPSPATTFAHLDATVVLSRQIASLAPGQLTKPGVAAGGEDHRLRRSAHHVGAHNQADNGTLAG